MTQKNNTTNRGGCQDRFEAASSFSSKVGGALLTAPPLLFRR